MERIPLLILEPAAAAILPGERRRLLLSTDSMRAAVQLAQHRGTGLVAVAFDPAQLREGETPAAEPDRLLSVGTACTLLRAGVGYAVVRGLHRASAEVTTGGACCDPEDPSVAGALVYAPERTVGAGAGDEALFAGLLADLEPLGVREPARMHRAPLLARLDRIAHGLGLAPWVQAEVLTSPTIAEGIHRLRTALTELAAPGASFRQAEGDLPYRDAEEHLADLVRLWDSRATARAPLGVAEADPDVALVRTAALRRRRRAAALRERAIAARIARRLAASAREGALPPLESVRAAHGLGPRDLEALLAAGLADHDRLGDPMRRAARLLPPGEMPLAAWIDALEAGAFSR